MEEQAAATDVRSSAVADAATATEGQEASSPHVAAHDGGREEVPKGCGGEANEEESGRGESSVEAAAVQQGGTAEQHKESPVITVTFTTSPSQDSEEIDGSMEVETSDGAGTDGEESDDSPASSQSSSSSFCGGSPDTPPAITAPSAPYAGIQISIKNDHAVSPSPTPSDSTLAPGDLAAGSTEAGGEGGGECAEGAARDGNESSDEPVISVRLSSAADVNCAAASADQGVGNGEPSAASSEGSAVDGVTPADAPTSIADGASPAAGPASSVAAAADDDDDAGQAGGVHGRQSAVDDTSTSDADIEDGEVVEESNEAVKESNEVVRMDIEEQEEEVPSTSKGNDGGASSVDAEQSRAATPAASALPQDPRRRPNARALSAATGPTPTDPRQPPPPPRPNLPTDPRRIPAGKKLQRSNDAALSFDAFLAPSPRAGASRAASSSTAAAVPSSSARPSSARSQVSAPPSAVPARALPTQVAKLTAQAIVHTHIAKAVEGRGGHAPSVAGGSRPSQAPDEAPAPKPRSYDPSDPLSMLEGSLSASGSLVSDSGRTLQRANVDPTLNQKRASRSFSQEKLVDEMRAEWEQRAADASRAPSTTPSTTSNAGGGAYTSSTAASDTGWGARHMEPAEPQRPQRPMTSASEKHIEKPKVEPWGSGPVSGSRELRNIREWLCRVCSTKNTPQELQCTKCSVSFEKGGIPIRKRKKEPTRTPTAGSTGGSSTASWPQANETLRDSGRGSGWGSSRTSPPPSSSSGWSPSPSGGAEHAYGGSSWPEASPNYRSVSSSPSSSSAPAWPEPVKRAPSARSSTPATTTKPHSEMSRKERRLLQLREGRQGVSRSGEMSPQSPQTGSDWASPSSSMDVDPPSAYSPPQDVAEERLNTGWGSSRRASSSSASASNAFGWPKMEPPASSITSGRSSGRDSYSSQRASASSRRDNSPPSGGGGSAWGGGGGASPTSSTGTAWPNKPPTSSSRHAKGGSSPTAPRSSLSSSTQGLSRKERMLQRAREKRGEPGAPHQSSFEVNQAGGGSGWGARSAPSEDAWGHRESTNHTRSSEYGDQDQSDVARGASLGWPTPAPIAAPTPSRGVDDAPSGKLTRKQKMLQRVRQSRQAASSGATDERSTLSHSSLPSARSESAWGAAPPAADQPTHTARGESVSAWGRSGEEGSQRRGSDSTRALVSSGSWGSSPSHSSSSQAESSSGWGQASSRSDAGARAGSGSSGWGDHSSSSTATRANARKADNVRATAGGSRKERMLQKVRASRGTAEAVSTWQTPSSAATHIATTNRSTSAVADDPSTRSSGTAASPGGWGKAAHSSAASPPPDEGRERGWSSRDAPERRGSSSKRSSPVSSTGAMSSRKQRMLEKARALKSGSPGGWGSAGNTPTRPDLSDGSGWGGTPDRSASPSPSGWSSSPSSSDDRRSTSPMDTRESVRDTRGSDERPRDLQHEPSKGMSRKQRALARVRKTSGAALSSGGSWGTPTRLADSGGWGEGSDYGGSPAQSSGWASPKPSDDCGRARGSREATSPAETPRDARRTGWGQPSAATASSPHSMHAAVSPVTDAAASSTSSRKARALARARQASSGAVGSGGTGSSGAPVGWGSHASARSPSPSQQSTSTGGWGAAAADGTGERGESGAVNRASARTGSWGSTVQESDPQAVDQPTDTAVSGQRDQAMSLSTSGQSSGGSMSRKERMLAKVRGRQGSGGNGGSGWGAPPPTSSSESADTGTGGSGFAPQGSQSGGWGSQISSTTPTTTSGWGTPNQPVPSDQGTVHPSAPQDTSQAPGGDGKRSRKQRMLEKARGRSSATSGGWGTPVQSASPPATSGGWGNPNVDSSDTDAMDNGFSSGAFPDESWHPDSLGNEGDAGNKPKKKKMRIPSIDKGAREMSDGSSSDEGGSKRTKKTEEFIKPARVSSRARRLARANEAKKVAEQLRKKREEKKKKDELMRIEREKQEQARLQQERKAQRAREAEKEEQREEEKKKKGEKERERASERERESNELKSDDDGEENDFDDCYSAEFDPVDLDTTTSMEIDDADNDGERAEKNAEIASSPEKTTEATKANSTKKANSTTKADSTKKMNTTTRKKKTKENDNGDRSNQFMRRKAAETAEARVTGVFKGSTSCTFFDRLEPSNAPSKFEGGVSQPMLRRVERAMRKETGVVQPCLHKDPVTRKGAWPLEDLQGPISVNGFVLYRPVRRKRARKKRKSVNAEGSPMFEVVKELDICGRVVRALKQLDKTGRGYQKGAEVVWLLTEISPLAGGGKGNRCFKEVHKGNKLRGMVDGALKKLLTGSGALELLQLMGAPEDVRQEFSDVTESLVCPVEFQHTSSQKTKSVKPPPSQETKKKKTTTSDGRRRKKKVAENAKWKVTDTFFYKTSSQPLRRLTIAGADGLSDSAELTEAWLGSDVGRLLDFPEYLAVSAQYPSDLRFHTKLGTTEHSILFSTDGVFRLMNEAFDCPEAGMFLLFFTAVVSGELDSNDPPWQPPNEGLNVGVKRKRKGPERLAADDLVKPERAKRQKVARKEKPSAPKVVKEKKAPTKATPEVRSKLTAMPRSLISPPRNKKKKKVLESPSSNGDSTDEEEVPAATDDMDVEFPAATAMDVERPVPRAKKPKAKKTSPKVAPEDPAPAPAVKGRIVSLPPPTLRFSKWSDEEFPRMAYRSMESKVLNLLEDAPLLPPSFTLFGLGSFEEEDPKALRHLERCFKENPQPNKLEVEEISARVQWERVNVQRWFEHRRVCASAQRDWHSAAVDSFSSRVHIVEGVLSPDEVYLVCRGLLVNLLTVWTEGELDRSYVFDAPHDQVIGNVLLKKCDVPRPALSQCLLRMLQRAIGEEFNSILIMHGDPRDNAWKADMETPAGVLKTARIAYWSPGGTVDYTWRTQKRLRGAVPSTVTRVTPSDIVYIEGGSATESAVGWECMRERQRGFDVTSLSITAWYVEEE